MNTNINTSPPANRRNNESKLQSIVLIKKHLKDNGIKQSFLAEKIDISESYLSNIFADRDVLTDEILAEINKFWNTQY